MYIYYLFIYFKVGFCIRGIYLARNARRVTHSSDEMQEYRHNRSDHFLEETLAGFAQAPPFQAVQ